MVDTFKRLVERCSLTHCACSKDSIGTLVLSNLKKKKTPTGSANPASLLSPILHHAPQGASVNEIVESQAVRDHTAGGEGRFLAKGTT
jgi:hypothetical protein